jgi:hypothetical protein
MEKLFNKNYVMVLLLMVMPLFSSAQEGGNLEPPPTPIDDYVTTFAFVAVLIAAFYFYRTNLKTIKK